MIEQVEHFAVKEANVLYFIRAQSAACLPNYAHRNYAPRWLKKFFRVVVELEVLQAKSNLGKNSLNEFIGLIGVPMFRERNTRASISLIRRPDVTLPTPNRMSSSVYMPPQPSHTPRAPEVSSRIASTFSAISGSTRPYIAKMRMSTVEFCHKTDAYRTAARVEILDDQWNVDLPPFSPIDEPLQLFCSSLATT